MTHLLYILPILLSAIMPDNHIIRDSLEENTLLRTPGPEVCFMANTVVYKDSIGRVIEGTPAQNVDLWTTGPLVTFSKYGNIKFNSEGDVVSGFAANDFIAQCSDGVFRRFEAMHFMQFDSCGLVCSGNFSDVVSISVAAAYKKGNILISAGSPTTFYACGSIRSAVLARRTWLVTASGQEKNIAQGKTVFFDKNGFLMDN